MKRTTMLIAACGTLVFTGCKPSDDRVPKVNEPPAPRVETSATANGTAERSATQEKLRAALKELDTKMAELKAQAQSAGDKAKAEWEARRPQLEAQRESASKKLDELGASSKDTWEETRKKTEAAFAELEQGFKDAWGKIKE